MRFVYMVRCSDGSLYTGITTDVEKRISDHNTSKLWAKYTKARRPVVLVWSKKVKDKIVACQEEFRIKKIKKCEKELLIKGKKHKKKDSESIALLKKRGILLRVCK